MIDFEKIRDLYNISKDLRFRDIQVLLKNAKRRTFLPGGGYLIEEGSLQKNIFFIIEGLIRSFKINDKGEEITTHLWWENQVLFGSSDAILFEQPSRFFYAVLEPTEVFCIDFETLETIVLENPKLEANKRFFIHETTRQLTKRLDSFILLSPEERYIEFITSNPHLVHRVADKHIANILGITPVSLSRIRKRIATKKS